MKITNKYGLPEPFVQALVKNYRPTPNRYGVTTLLRGATQTVLERRHHDEITMDASEGIFMIFGTAVHQILENSGDQPGIYKEFRLEVPAGDGKSVISGIADVYDSNTGTVIDYKTGSVWKAKIGDWEDYRRQIALYAWMLNAHGYPCHTGQIVLMMKDHSKAEAKRKPDYPPYPVHVQTFHFTDEELSQAHREALDKVLLIRDLMELPTEDLPPCAPEERWNTGDRWAVMSDPKKKAVRVLDSREAAEKYMEDTGKGKYIEARPGQDKRCADYCSVSSFCPYWRKKNDQTDG